MIFQIMNISGQLDVKEFHLFDASITAPLNVVPITDTIKQFLEIPQRIYTFVASLNPTKSSLFTWIEWLTGSSEKDFLKFILYFVTFAYFFLLTSIFAKLSTVFPIEKDQKVFFSFTLIAYLIVVKLVWNL